MKTIAFYFLLFFTAKLFAQINTNFIKHLNDNKLYNEENYYLNNSLNNKSITDSVNYFNAKMHLSLHNDSLFFKHYFLSSKLYDSDSAAIRVTHYYFLKHTSSFYQNKWFALHTKSTNPINQSILYLYHNQINDFVSPLNSTLIKDFKQYNKVKNKKPVIAGLLSAIVPGLGKLYGQRPNSALVTVFSQSIFAYQAYESINKFGIKNGYSIFTTSFFGLFYLSNIYGSYHDLISLKKQRKKQLLIDAEKYLHINYPANLY